MAAETSFSFSIWERCKVKRHVSKDLPQVFEFLLGEDILGQKLVALGNCFWSLQSHCLRMAAVGFLGERTSWARNQLLQGTVFDLYLVFAKPLVETGSRGIQTHASGETGTWIQRLRLLGHATTLLEQSFNILQMPCSGQKQVARQEGGGAVSQHQHLEVNSHGAFSGPSKQSSDVAL